jgi:hypothetical protein
LKEAALACFDVLFRHLPDLTEDNHENVGQNFRFLGRELKSEPHQHEEEIVTSRA